MTIAGIVAAGKERLSQAPRDILVVCILVFASLASFGLGILAGRDMGQGSGFSITEVPLTASPLGAASPAQNAAATLPAGGQVVASKNGSKYFLPWCGGANQIKEANKVWFASREAAEKAGYTPAGNCKGL